MAGPKSGHAIDTVMKGVPKTPGFSQARGKYNENPHLGPKGVDGGLPLKFTDDSVPTPTVQPTSNPGMIATPMAKGSKK